MNKSKPVCVKITEAGFNEALEDYIGWCQDCADFTTDCVEPDAEGRMCDICEHRSVIGAEQALLLGLIEFE